MAGWWPAALVAALVLFAIARKARPAANQAGGPLVPPQSVSPDPLRIATYNIQTGKSFEGKRDIHRSASVLKDADLAGVQEVYAASWLNRLGFGRSQTESLAASGGFAHIFCATRRRWFREHRGNALLSKLPVRQWRVIMLPDQSGKSYRNMTVSEVQWQDQQFWLINTHLHTRAGREEQLEVVLREFSRYSRAILLGDFNTRADSPQLTAALRDPQTTDAIAAAGLDKDNPERIDWIFTRGFDVLGGRYVDKGVSDHPYYEVHLKYRL